MKNKMKWLMCALTASLVLQGCSSDDDEAIQLPTGTLDGHYYVDIGLSVKWATCNVGASSPSDYGDYFAWGETETKSEYTEDNSVTFGKEMEDIAGDSDYDAARVNWGGAWRIPTADEIGELMNKCQWEWTTMDGHTGYQITGPNGKSIFLPAAGWRNKTLVGLAGDNGHYWCSSPEGSGSSSAYSLGFGKQDFGKYSFSRAVGQSIRPVSGEKDSLVENEVTSGTINGHDYVDLGLSKKCATCNVGASSSSDYGDYFAWGETETKDEYTVSNSATYNKEMEDIAGDPLYDAAQANWGGTWQLPTADEFDELIDKCQWDWTTKGGHNGYKVTGPNGNSIFLPAAGWRGTALYNAGDGGYYWSSSPYEIYSSNAYYLRFYYQYFRSGWADRYYGRSVRPVTE
ncbi:MAG: hypothetical protein LUI04_06400 [Porphyromonadaceae bacterium]|nr:hypothetical protein [Porphyromonadaceae bacterium]